MAFNVIWTVTKLPKEMVDILCSDLEQYDRDLDASEIVNKHDRINKNIRNSKNAWIPTTHWVGGFIWHYIQKANRENFLYDLTNIDAETIQYTEYGPGQFYTWHKDQDLESFYTPVNTGGMGSDIGADIVANQGRLIRKLSFSVQLSGPEEYTGGEFQCLNGSGGSYFVPKERGTVVVFDSRVVHRVRPVKTGVRKSLVGWVVGPRWR